MTNEEMKKDFIDLDEPTRAIVKLWIHTNLYPTLHGRIGAYGLKHDLQNDTGIYITEKHMGQALEECHIDKNGKFYRCGQYTVRGAALNKNRSVHDTWKAVCDIIGAKSDF